MNIWKLTLPVVATALLAGCAAEQAAPVEEPVTITPLTTTPSSTPAPTTPVASAPATVTVTAAPPVVDGPPKPCADTDLVVSNRPLESQGSEYRVVLLFENTSSTACTLQGYPGADIVNEDSSTLHVERRQQIAAPLLTLEPGEVATADLQASDVNRATESPCGDWGLVVIIAPNTFQQRHLDLGLPMCSALISSVT